MLVFSSRILRQCLRRVLVSVVNFPWSTTEPPHAAFRTCASVELLCFMCAELRCLRRVSEVAGCYRSTTENLRATSKSSSFNCVKLLLSSRFTHSELLFSACVRCVHPVRMALEVRPTFTKPDVELLYFFSMSTPNLDVIC